MKNVTSRVYGNLIVSEDTTYFYVSASEVTVEANIVARLFGIISNRLQVEENSIVYLHGRCDGEIVNNGGVVYQILPSGIVNCLTDSQSQ